jgi:hypothetical protein
MLKTAAMLIFSSRNLLPGRSHSLSPPSSCALVTQAIVKLGYLEKLLANQAAQPGPLPSLVSGLQVMQHAVEAHAQAQRVSAARGNPQPLSFSHGQQVLALMEPCFTARNISASIVKDLCSVVKAVYALAAAGGGGAAAVAAAAAPTPPPEQPVSNEVSWLIVSLCLSVHGSP